MDATNVVSIPFAQKTLPLMTKDPTNQETPMSKTQKTLIGVGVGALIGLVIGAVKYFLTDHT